MGQLLDSAKANTGRKGSRCTIAEARQQLAGRKDKTLAKDLDAALADPSITSTAIAKALRGIEAAVSANALQRHRRGDCTCNRV